MFGNSKLQISVSNLTVAVIRIQITQEAKIQYLKDEGKR